MIPLLCRVVGAVVALLMLCGCALTKDWFRGVPTQGQTEEQRLQDQDDCNAIALANKGSAAQAWAAMATMGVAVGAGAGAVIGAGLRRARQRGHSRRRRRGCWRRRSPRPQSSRSSVAEPPSTPRMEGRGYKVGE